MNRSNRHWKQILAQEHCGVVAIESTILMPLMFLTMLALLYMLFMVLSYITYSNIASNIAHQMNMRQSGYETALARYGTTNMPTVYSHVVKSNGAVVDGVYNDNAYATNELSNVLTLGDLIFCDDYYSHGNDTPLLRSGLLFALDVTGRKSTGHNAMDGVGDQFIIPFVDVDTITCNASKKLEYTEGDDRGNQVFANTVITIKIKCNCVNPLGLFNMWNNNRLGGGINNGQFSSLISFVATGYDVIA